MSNKIDLDALDLSELKTLIADAQKEIKRKEKAKVRDVRGEMEKLANKLGMTVEEVINYDKGRKSTSKPGVPRFRNPEAPEQTWTGRGKRPRWYVDALKRGIEPKEMEIR